MRPRAIVTCGPAHSPIDAVRRLTNSSTGELGCLLAEALRAADWDVLCLRGEGATHRAPERVRLAAFGTNASLERSLRRHAGRADAVFHAAALCDFEVVAPARCKWRSEDAAPVIRLRHAKKLLPCLRGWFPSAWIAGWKYEVDGTRRDALDEGRAQLAACGTNACVVNGPAYGAGFGLLTPRHAHLRDSRALCERLVAAAGRP